MKRLLITTSVLLFSLTSSAAEFTLTWGVNVEPIIYFKKSAAEFKKRVEKKSKNRIKVNIIENEITEIDHDHLADVTNGKYDMGQSPVSYLEKKFPELGIWDLPYLFQDDKHVLAYMQTTEAKKAIEGLRQYGAEPIDYTFSGGFVFVVGQRMDSFEQLKGYPFGQESAGTAFREFLDKSLKAPYAKNDYAILIEKDKEPTVSEIIGSTIDEVFHFTKQQKLHLNKTDHRVISRVLYISTKFLNSLPPDLRELVITEAKAAAAREKQLSIDDKNRKLKIAAKNGFIMNEWSIEKKQKEVEIFAPMYEAYSKKFGTATLDSIKALKMNHKKASKPEESKNPAKIKSAQNTQSSLEN